jgi:hypothetical protein
MAPDQRYCLECGTRRAHLGGVREGLRALAPTASTATAAVPGSASAGPAAPGASGGAGGDAVNGVPAPTTRGSGATAVIAGVGVLLLSMGVGVLIGRTGSGGGKAAAAPEVISVAQPGAGTTGTAGAAPTTPTTTTSTPSHSSAPKQSKGSSSSTGVGQELGKPAPPTVLQNLHKSGGGSYEQKSKNLPNVVSTG